MSLSFTQNSLRAPLATASIFILALLNSGISSSQEIGGYELIHEINKHSYVADHAGKGGVLSPRFFVSIDEKFLFLKYGFKPTVLSIFQIEPFQHIKTCEVSPWLHSIGVSENYIYAIGEDALRRDVFYKISVVTGAKTKVINVPSGTVLASKHEGEILLDGLNFLLARSNSDVFSIYRSTGNNSLESENLKILNVKSEGAQADVDDNIRIRMSGRDNPIQRVAVIGKEGELCDGMSDDGQGIAELVEGELLGIYEVVERRHLEEIIQEQRLVMSGLVFEDSDFAKAGCLAGAQGTVIVSYSCLQDKIKLQIKLVDCSTSDLFWSATGIDVSEFELLDALRIELAKR